MTLTTLTVLAAVTISAPDEVRPSEKFAAEELKTWTAKLGVADVDAELVRDDALGEDGFRLRTEKGKLTVSGGRRGILYGVYEALERFGGIRWLSLNTTVVPAKGGFRPPPKLDEVQKPAFELREPYWYDAMHDADFAARLRINAKQIEARHGGCTHLFDTKLRNCHTFAWLVPVEEYFDAHPEYFSFFKGKRQKDRTQLCLTNPDVFAIVLKKVLAQIEANPGAKYFGVSQNDWAGYCECPACAAVDAEEGSHAGQVVRFVNALAAEVEKRHPDKVIETLAYQWSRKPPKKTKLRSNVMPCLCSIECEFNTPLEKSFNAANKSFVEDLKGWAAQTDRLYVWDYTTDFADYLYPFPNVNVLQDNLRLFRDSKVKSVFAQGAYQGRHGDFAELKTYLLSKWMWNPELPREKLMNDFFNGYYGKAAKTVRRYFDVLHRQGRADGVPPLGIYESAYSMMLSDDFLDYASSLWDEAEAQVKGSPLHEYNVRMGRLPVDVTRLLRHADAKNRWPEYQALAKRVLARLAEEPKIRLSETAGGKMDEKLISDFRRYAAKSFAEITADTELKLAEARNTAEPVDRFVFEADGIYKLQVHAKGGAFSAGVDDWDSVYRHGSRAYKAEEVGKEGAWYDVITWRISGGEYIWFAGDPEARIDGMRLVPGRLENCDSRQLELAHLPRAIRAANVVEHRRYELQPGLELTYVYCEKLFNHSNELYVLTLDLEKSKVRPALREGALEANFTKRLMRTSSAAAKMNALVAVNGGFFKWKELIPYYAMKLDGKVLKTTAGGNYGMAWSNDGSKVTIGKVKVEEWDNFFAGEAGIIQNGAIELDWKRKPYVKPGAPHTFHGMDRSGKRWMTFQCSGRKSGKKTCSWGFDYQECGDVAMWFGCKEAVMEDGGGSSAFVVHESTLKKYPQPWTPEAHPAGDNAPGYWILNCPSDFNGTERAVLDQVVFR